MKPFIIDRIERERRQRQEQDRGPIPLRIQPPPPEWVEEQQRKHEQGRRSERGVHIVGEDEAPQRGVVIIDMA